jgi:hypothetical protein
MSHREIDPLQTSCEDARALLVDLEINPSVFEPARIVEGYRHLLAFMVPLKPGKHTRLDHELTTVTDAQDQLPITNESQDLIIDPLAGRLDPSIAEAIRRCLSCPEIITVEESAWKREELIIVETLCPLD